MVDDEDLETDDERASNASISNKKSIKLEDNEDDDRFGIKTISHCEKKR